MKTALKLLAPYIAVAIFWCGFANAWLAILTYHLQILLWPRTGRHNMRAPSGQKAILVTLPCALAGPLLYYLLPGITRTQLSAWLSTHHLSGVSLLLMIPYFGLVHPFMEQIHWHPLREDTVLAHLIFAGYHMLVLCSLLTVPWLLLSFAVLVAAFLAWQQAARTTHSLRTPTISHVLADLGVVLAAWARMQ